MSRPTGHGDAPLPRQNRDRHNDGYSATELDVGWGADAGELRAPQAPGLEAPGSAEDATRELPAAEPWAVRAAGDGEAALGATVPLPEEQGTGSPPAPDAGTDSGSGESATPAVEPATVREAPADATVPLPDRPSSGSARPARDFDTGRAPGEVLRFGPGVPQCAPSAGAAVSVAAQPPPSGRARRLGAGLRRYTLAALVLLAVLAYLGWERLSPGLAVEQVAVRTDPRGPACDGTADVVAVIRTNGEPGTLRYRWQRNDGTRSEPLHERVAEGQREVRLLLLWSFRGEGRYEARAELRLAAPAERTAATRFTYTCG